MKGGKGLWHFYFIARTLTPGRITKSHAGRGALGCLRVPPWGRVSKPRSRKAELHLKGAFENLLFQSGTEEGWSK